MTAAALPALPRERLHLPFEAGPFRLALGLVSCPAAEMIELDERYPTELEQRRALLDGRRSEVLACCPGAEAACTETLAVLATLLAEARPEFFRKDGDVLRNGLTGEAWDLRRPSPVGALEVAGRLVQEDLCLLRPGEGGPVLEAAVLCAPSRWRLSEKIGRPLIAVHGPVPGYAERLGAPVDRLVGQIRPGRVALRMNWSVVDDGALFQPGGKFRTMKDPDVTRENAGQRLFLRVERQTLSKLPASGRVLFTIRVHSYRLERVVRGNGAAGRLAAAVRALPDDMAAYKSLPVFQDALLEYLDGVAA